MVRYAEGEPFLHAAIPREYAQGCKAYVRCKKFPHLLSTRVKARRVLPIQGIRGRKYCAEARWYREAPASPLHKRGGAFCFGKQTLRP